MPDEPLAEHNDMPAIVLDAHGKQNDIPIIGPNDPTGQIAHDAEFTVALNVPAAHGKHCVPPEMKPPAGHDPDPPDTPDMPDMPDMPIPDIMPPDMPEPRNSNHANVNPNAYAIVKQKNVKQRHTQTQMTMTKQNKKTNRKTKRRDDAHVNMGLGTSVKRWGSRSAHHLATVSRRGNVQVTPTTEWWRRRWRALPPG
jgi:hypothetical protein